MATLADLVNEVYTITNRPDLVAETTAAVKAATLKAHQTDFYYKDILEIPVEFPSDAYIQALEYRAIVPLYRALSYLRLTDSTGIDTGPLLDICTPHETIDNYGVNKTNIAYVAGQVIQIRADAKFQYIFLGCYVHPSIVDATYNSWIANEHPYAIIFDACATIFKMIGFDEQAKMYRDMVNEQLAEVKISNIQAEGY